MKPKKKVSSRRSNSHKTKVAVVETSTKTAATPPVATESTELTLDTEQLVAALKNEFSIGGISRHEFDQPDIPPCDHNSASVSDCDYDIQSTPVVSIKRRGPLQWFKKNDHRSFGGTNLKENPFAAYKASGRWTTAWFYSSDGLLVAEWQTQAGNIHYVSSFKLHDVIIPWYVRWMKKPKVAKFIFHTATSQPSNRKSTKLEMRQAFVHIYKSAKPIFALVKNNKQRQRSWGESWPKYIKRKLVEVCNRKTVSKFLRDKISLWENNGKKMTAMTDQRFGYIDVFELD